MAIDPETQVELDKKANLAGNNSFTGSNTFSVASVSSTPTAPTHVVRLAEVSAIQQSVNTAVSESSAALRTATSADAKAALVANEFATITIQVNKATTAALGAAQSAQASRDNYTGSMEQATIATAKATQVAGDASIVALNKQAAITAASQALTHSQSARDYADQAMQAKIDAQTVAGAIGLDTQGNLGVANNLTVEGITTTKGVINALSGVTNLPAPVNDSDAARKIDLDNKQYVFISEQYAEPFVNQPTWDGALSSSFLEDTYYVVHKLTDTTFKLGSSYRANVASVDTDSLIDQIFTISDADALKDNEAVDWVDLATNPKLRPISRNLKYKLNGESYKRITTGPIIDYDLEVEFLIYTTQLHPVMAWMPLPYKYSKLNYNIDGNSLDYFYVTNSNNYGGGTTPRTKYKLLRISAKFSYCRATNKIDGTMQGSATFFNGTFSNWTDVQHSTLPKRNISLLEVEGRILMEQKWNQYSNSSYGGYFAGSKTTWKYIKKEPAIN